VNEAAPAPEDAPRPLPYSVLILTLDEEINLPGCLASIRGCDDIVVLDSGSRDRTVEIARQAGARVFVRAFDTFAQQRNYAQREIPFRHPWVLHLDADERMSIPLRLECGGVLGSENVDGFLAVSKIYWDGHWVRRSSKFPRWQVRLVRAPEFQFADGPDGAREAGHMRMGELNTSSSHDASLRTEAELLERHRRYAAHLARHHRDSVAHAPLSGIFSSDRARRDCARRRLWHALPFRPALKFVHRYLFCGGFLEGRAGYNHCRQLMRYEELITEELRHRASHSRSAT
jgi:glycosyltransferase involved in cell wall biosynthesis